MIGFATRIAARSWNSPTLTTWASLAARSLGLVAVFPLAARQFKAEELVVWQLLVSISALLILLDLGLSPTFSRLIAFAMGGTSTVKDSKTGIPADATGGPDWPQIERIWSTMSSLYRWSSLGSIPVMVVIGSVTLWNPISKMPSPAEGWLAWGIVWSTTPVNFLAIGYAAYLQGLNEVSSFRRWEALTALGGIGCSLVVLSAGGGIVALVTCTQAWTVIRFLRNRTLARNVAAGRLCHFKSSGVDKEIFALAWPAAWRSGLGVLITSGFIHMTGVIYSQIASAIQASAYLFGLRYVMAIGQFSVAPFYSRLPMLARLYAKGDTRALLQRAERGMRLSNWAYVSGITLFTFALPILLERSGGGSVVPSKGLWWLLAFAFLGERLGAMHLQLYSVTNKIVWHTVSIASGSISLLTSAVAFPILGSTALPLGILSGYWLFYVPFCAKLAYNQFGLRPMELDYRTSLAPFLLLVAIAAMDLI